MPSASSSGLRLIVLCLMSLLCQCLLPSFEYPPRTYIMMFHSLDIVVSIPPKWCILPCLLFFLCSSICYPWAAHLQQKNLLSYFVHDIRASILLAPTSVFSAKTGTSQYAVMELFSVIGSGALGEYQGGMDSARSYSVSSSKYKILCAALCLARYLVCARALQPAITCSTVSGTSPHILQITSVVVVIPVFL